jgi:hypothetical protein
MGAIVLLFQQIAAMTQRRRDELANHAAEDTRVAPIGPWLMDRASLEGYEDIWRHAAIHPPAVLPYVLHRRR